MVEVTEYEPKDISTQMSEQVEVTISLTPCYDSEDEFSLSHDFYKLKVFAWDSSGKTNDLARYVQIDQLYLIENTTFSNNKIELQPKNKDPIKIKLIQDKDCNCYSGIYIFKKPIIEFKNNSKIIVSGEISLMPYGHNKILKEVLTGKTRCISTLKSYLR